MGKIIGISGRKQSGKNTFANYVNGSILKSRDMIQDFFINENGKLVVKTTDHDGKSGYGILDVMRKDVSFIEYAELDLWPYVKVYSFADYLKDICISLFNFKYDQAYGTDDDKNTLVDILWESMPYSKKKGKMTAREFMQHFGTNVIRKFKDDAWVSNTLKRIISEDSEVSIIADVRFPNGVEAIKNAGGINIRLTRNIFDDSHKCETSLDENNFDWSKFDIVIDNSNLSIEEFCSKIEENRKIWI